MDSLTWYQAMAFCDWLGRHGTWKGARLPTEVEWEYACRAGSNDGILASAITTSQLGDYGWFDTITIRAAKLSRWARRYSQMVGVCYDMHGNVWEWTVSPFNSYAEGTRHVDPAAFPADLAEPDPRAHRVMRGGGYWGGPQLVRSACRDRGDPGFGSGSLGFRVLLPCAPSEP